MKTILTYLISFVSFFLQAQTPDTPAVFPKPQQMEWKEGRFNLSATYTYLEGVRGNAAVATYFNQQLKKQYGFSLKTTSQAGTHHIVLSIQRNAERKGGYQISVTKDNIAVTGSDSAGLFYSIQTLLQLIEKKTTKRETPRYTYSIPSVEITDAPRFAYRGMHLDVCRHFWTVDEVKQYIDYLAAYKFNTFHWHLTDDQGWRIEIKKYPKLTSVGGWRNGTIISRYPGTGNDGLRYGGFYTQAQIKEVVKYAADRYITIIPEIEMPGHASAAIAAYPQLSCFPNESTQHPKDCAWAGDTTGKQVQQTWGVFDDVFCPSETTFQFLQDVVDEVLPLFPSKYIHIGGDECPKTNWKRSAFCQNLMKEKGLKTEHELQSYFIQRMEQYINSKGRRIIGWDEILEGGLAPNASVMSWTGEEGGIKAAQQAHDVVMTPGGYCYFDHSQSKNEDSVTFGSYLPIETVYGYNPVPAALNENQSKHILGAQANVWTEYIGNFSKLQYTIFPRIAAISEVLWTQKENKGWDDFEKRLPVLFNRLEKKDIHYSKAYYAIIDSVLPAADRNGVVWKLSSKVKSQRFIVTNISLERKKEISKQFIPDHSEHLEYTLNSENYVQNIREAQQLEAQLYDSIHLGNNLSTRPNPLTRVTKNFSFNKATGKNITLITPLSKSYPGNGAFTLVDGVQNVKKLERSSEFLGFSGKDCEAIIDLGKSDTISKVIVHSLNQQSSWIHPPKSIEVSLSEDGNTYTTQRMVVPVASNPGNVAFTISFPAAKARFVKLKIANAGIIPEGNAGAGNAAWLFVDEVEVW